MVSCPVCAFHLGDPRPNACPSCGVDFTDVPESYILKGPRKNPGTGVPLIIQVLSSLSVILYVIAYYLQKNYNLILPPTIRYPIILGVFVFFIWIGLWIEKNWKDTN